MYPSEDKRGEGKRGHNCDGVTVRLGLQVQIERKEVPTVPRQVKVRASPGFCNEGVQLKRMIYTRKKI